MWPRLTGYWVSGARKWRTIMLWARWIDTNCLLAIPIWCSEWHSFQSKPQFSSLTTRTKLRFRNAHRNWSNDNKFPWLASIFVMNICFHHHHHLLDDSKCIVPHSRKSSSILSSSHCEYIIEFFVCVWERKRSLLNYLPCYSDKLDLIYRKCQEIDCKPTNLSNLKWFRFHFIFYWSKNLLGNACEMENSIIAFI